MCHDRHGAQLRNGDQLVSSTTDADIKDVTIVKKARELSKEDVVKHKITSCHQQVEGVLGASCDACAASPGIELTHGG